MSLVGLGSTLSSVDHSIPTLLGKEDTDSDYILTSQQQLLPFIGDCLPSMGGCTSSPGSNAELFSVSNCLPFVTMLNHFYLAYSPNVYMFCILC